VHSLPIFVRLKGRPVILVGEGPPADAKRRLLDRAGATIVDAHDAAAHIAIIAVDALPEAEAAAAALRARGVLVNVVDRPALSDFTMPAIVDRDPVIVAVATGGASAGLAKALRQRIEAVLPQNLGALAQALSEARSRLVAMLPEGRQRRAAIDAALAQGGLLDPMDDRSASRVDAWLARPGDLPAPRLETIALTSPDPDELTLRAARLLGEADVIWHSANVPQAILNRARADAVRHVAEVPPAVPADGLSLWLHMDRRPC